MRNFYESFALSTKDNWRIKPFVRIAFPCIMLFLISLSLVTPTIGEEIDWRLVKEVTLDDPPIDISTSLDGSYIFILTGKTVLVYSRKDDKIVNRIPVGRDFDKISFSKARNEFILTNTSSKTLSVIKIYPIYQIDISNQPSSGPLNAAVTIVVFDDYQCSACAILEKVLKDVMKSYSEEIKLVIKNYPNSKDQLSVKAAAASRAAHVQGKFWEFRHELFENQASLNEDIIQEIATQLELDMTKFNQDLNSQDIKALVDRDLKDGRQLGLKATPMIFINGKFLEGNSLQVITEMIEAELNKQRTAVK